MISEVSIIIPVYNAQDYLSTTITSVMQQSFLNWELIIIDDGSSDSSLQIAEHYKEKDSRIQVYTQPNQGVAAARNKGIDVSCSSARYIMFLDNDDYLEEIAIETLKSLLERHLDASAAYGLPRDVDKNGNTIHQDPSLSFGYNRFAIRNNRLVTIESDSDTTFTSLVIWPCIATPGQVLIRKSFLQLIGYFDNATVPSDDWDLFLRLSLIGNLKFIREFVINKRIHDTNVSSKGKVMRVAEPVIRHKLATSSAISMENRRIAKIGHLYSCYIKLTWSKSEFSNGRYTNGLKTVYRSLRSFIHFLKTPYI